MRADLRRDPEVLERAAVALDELAGGVRADDTDDADDRSVRLRRIADELASLATSARRAASCARSVDDDIAATFRAAGR